jgi:hypothetical protein
MIAEADKIFSGNLTTTPPVLNTFGQCLDTLPQSAQNIQRVTFMERDIPSQNRIYKEFVDMARNSKISVNSSDPIETKITKEENARQICKTYLDRVNERQKNITADNIVGLVEASVDIGLCMTSNLCANELLERVDSEGLISSLNSEATMRCMENFQ